MVIIVCQNCEPIWLERDNAVKNFCASHKVSPIPPPQKKKLITTRTGEPANFLAAPAPAPRGQKHPAPIGSDQLRLLGKIFFSLQTSKVNLQKKYKTSKIIVF